MRFIVFLVRLVEKLPKIAKSGQNVGGLMQRRSDPRSGEGFLRRNVAKRGNFAILGFIAAKLITQKIYVFCFLLFCSSEDLSIGLMRTL